MKTIKLLCVAGVAVLALNGCGGGGGDPGTGFGDGSGSGTGGDGSGSVGTPTIAVALVDGSGTVINPPVITGGSDFKVKVTLRDGAGAAIASKTVAVAAADLTLTPATGKKITSSSGVAEFAATQTNANLATASSVCASANVNAAEVTNCIDIQLGAVSATVTSISASALTIPAYQTTQISAIVNQNGTSTPATGVPVLFSASCGKISPASTVTDNTGLAGVSFTNDNGAGSSCSGNVTVTASTQGSSRTVALTAQAPVPANIQFVQASPARIYLKGSPSTSTSTVSFKLLDASNNAISGRNVRLDLLLYPAQTYLGATQGATSLVATTDANGVVAASVNAGTAPGPVQVKATLLSASGADTSTVNVSNGLAIASGLPTQTAFSLSVSTFNIEAANTDGVTTTLTVRAADRLGNPVPDGTTVNFVTEGGQIVGSCSTTGAAAGGIAACSATLSSQAFRPGNMRVSVLAWAQGEESFVDLSVPSNNVYDLGVDTYTELGQPYLDKDFDNVRDPGEESVGVAAGSAACPATPPNSGIWSVPNSCNGTWGNALVYRQTEIVFSDSKPDETLMDASFDGCNYTFTLKDKFGNPLPAGTALSVTNVSGGATVGNATFLGFGGEGATVPNTNDVDRTVHVARFAQCTAPSTLVFQLKILTPAGIETSYVVEHF
ncbi:MAG: hypothetical protein EOP50_02815 [Sphingobacteriales bacterium]|nr:MAG: hypothetical protein EOP50_02815 [Sphingobacteriales bacterium]